MNKSIVLALCLLLGSMGLTAQNYFQKTFGGPGEDTGYSVQIAHDNNYLLVGSTENAGAGNKDILLLKTTTDGNVIWSKTYGGGNDDYPSLVIRTADLGYAILGITYSFGSGNKDIYLLKLDGNGNVIWSKCYGGPNEERGLIIHQTFDNGYIIAGSTESYGFGSKDAYVLKVDESGNVEWTTVMGGELSDTNLDIKPVADGYILANAISSYGIGGYDFNVTKLDLSGIFLWSKNIGGTSDDNPIVLNATEDGGVIVGGHTRSWGVGDWDMMLTKIDSNGNIVWNKIYGGGNYDFIRQMTTLSDGNYLIFGYNHTINVLTDAIYISKMTPEGQILWSKYYGIDGIQYWNPFHGSIPAIEDGEGSIIFAGERNDFTNRDIFFVKTSQQGISYDCDGGIFFYTETNVIPTIINTVPAITSGGNTVTPVTIQGVYDIPEITFCNTITPPTPPTPNTNICAPSCIDFSDISTSIDSPTQWLWTFEGAEPPFSAEQNPTEICYNYAGVYDVSLIVSNDNGDSYILSWPSYITVMPYYHSDTEVSICSGESIVLGGSPQTTSGIYTDSLTTVQGCDSIITTVLTVLSSPQLSLELDNNRICADNAVEAAAGILPPSPEDVQVFVLHNSPNNDFSSASFVMYGNNTTGIFVNDGSAPRNIPIYITFITGDDNGNGFPNLSDPCISTSPAVEVVFLNPVHLLVNEYCDWQALPNGIYYVTVYPQGGLPGYDNTATYTLGGDISAALSAGESFMTTYEGSTATQSYFVSVLNDGAGCGTTASNTFICYKTPVELLSFNGEIMPQGNLLTWTTASETENDYFTINRSTDNGQTFSKVAVIDGAGNSINAKSYEYIDRYTNAGTVYYYLTQTDINGTSKQIGSVVLLRTQTATALEISNILPVPATTSVEIQFNAVKDKAEAIVFDVTGREVLRQTIDTQVGGNTLPLNISHFSAGTYFLLLNDGTSTVSGKLLKK